jgi:hypothetical protein
MFAELELTQNRVVVRGPVLSSAESVDAQPPGEGVRAIDSSQALTPTLFPWEREQSALLKEFLVK